MTSTIADLDIHPRLDSPTLRGLIRPRHPLWTPAELRTLTSAVANRLLSRLVEVVRFSSPLRWWTRVAVTEEVEVWLLSWLPGQGTVPHDHGGAAGSFAVAMGELAETFRYPAGPIRNTLHTQGSVVAFGAGRAHQVQNLGAQPAASVHAYSPPLVPTRDYVSLRDVPDSIPTLPTQRATR
ncbi:cysteine dioxygenase [Alloactinosynnema sp. L-07]|uniref:cysteine dioxygenase n=1 Tax=Alloactinosynnema sp. L-07 TaxID=1653480 RepID=UPI00065EFF20|nr:cysteine dioxygenase family protein [Alloactinosynnema sp. L-07]CRK58946.1 cysteine dioxygenase [Alloactinosynnema sp. L-07]